MRILEGLEEQSALRWLEKAREVALYSPCKRSRCGSVITYVAQGGEKLLSVGFNAPPLNDPANARCDRKHELKAGFKSDRTCCVHAEQNAILRAMKSATWSLYKSNLYFVRLDDQGNIKPSGKPYCTICSKMALNAGISEFILLHQEGIAVYGTKEYNDLSYEYGGD